MKQKIINAFRCGEAYGFIADNYYEMDKTELKDVLLECIYALGTLETDQVAEELESLWEYAEIEYDGMESPMDNTYWVFKDFNTKDWCVWSDKDERVVCVCDTEAEAEEAILGSRWDEEKGNKPSEESWKIK